MNKRRHFADFHLAGFTYYDGVVVFEKLKVGTKLRLVREPDNKFDPYAVAIYYEDSKLGFVPRNENHTLSLFLEMGYEDLFETYINRVSSEANPEAQIGVNVFLIAKEN